jgi:hypothetical protein
MAKKNDVCRCIARVYRWGALRPHRCANPVWKDGYCKTHLTSPIKGVIIPKEDGDAIPVAPAQTPETDPDP